VMAIAAQAGGSRLSSAVRATVMRQCVRRRMLRAPMLPTEGDIVSNRLAFYDASRRFARQSLTGWTTTPALPLPTASGTTVRIIVYALDAPFTSALKRLPVAV